MNKLILMAITLFTVSCGNIIEITEADNAKARWGYYSEYIGAINEAQLPTNEEKKLMAEAIQPAINMANALINDYITYALAPDIISTRPANVRDPMRDNSTCLTNNMNDNGTTYREYNQFYDPANIPISFVYVKYNNYCLASGPLPNTISKILITYTPNAEALVGAKTESVMDNSSMIYYYMLLNRDVNIERIGNEVFNGKYTPFGIFERRGAISDLAGSKFRYGMDMKTGNDVNRFDVSFTGITPATKELTFFHTKYGYVTVTVDSKIGKPIQTTDEITFKYSGGTCTFTNLWLTSKDQIYIDLLNRNCYYKR